MRIRLGYGDGTWEQIEFDGTLHMAVKRFMLGANDRKCMEVELIDPEFEEEFGCIWSLKKVFYPSEEMIQRIAPYYRLYIIKEWVSGPWSGVLEPGEIDHSESSRNNQSKLIRNSQCTLTD